MLSHDDDLATTGTTEVRFVRTIGTQAPPSPMRCKAGVTRDGRSGLVSVEIRDTIDREATPGFVLGAKYQLTLTPDVRVDPDHSADPGGACPDLAPHG